MLGICHLHFDSNASGCSWPSRVPQGRGNVVWMGDRWFHHRLISLAPPGRTQHAPEGPQKVDGGATTGPVPPRCSRTSGAGEASVLTGGKQEFEVGEWG